jgi:hypothetical protein
LFVWHVLVVTCALMIFLTMFVVFFFQFPRNSFLIFLFHFSSFVASHCRLFHFLGCKQDKVSNLITLSKL